jgi:hypothetical protein
MLDLCFAALLLAAPPSGSEELRWIKALYPAGKIEGDTLTRIARDGVPGKIRDENVHKQKVKGGFVIAFLLELENEEQEGKYLQVIHVDTKGKFLGKAADPFPIGGTWGKDEEHGMDSERELVLISLQPIEGTDRAVLLDFTPTSTTFSSDQYQVFAVGRDGTLITGEPVGHGTRISGDSSKYISTFSDIRYEKGAVRATVRRDFELAYEDADDPELGKSKTEEVILLSLE